MLSAIILARALDTSAFAAYSYFQLTVSMLAAYASMGLGVTASKYFAQVGHESAENNTPPLGTLWCLSILFAILASATVMVTPDSWLSAGLEVPRWFLALGVLTVAFGIVPGGAILGLERYKQSTLISGFSGSLMLLGAWLAAKSGSPDIAMGAIIVAALVQAGGNSVIVVRAVGWKKILGGFGLSFTEVCYVFSFAGPMLFVSLMSASGAWLIGRIILHGYEGEQAFALYAIGLQWFSLGLLLPGMLSRVILPRLVRISGTEAAAESTKQLVKQGVWMAIVAAVSVAIVGFLLGPWLTVMYGDSYQSNSWIIIAFLVIAVLLAPANVVGNAIVANEGQMSWFCLTAMWLLVLVVTGLVFGQLGAWTGAVAHAASAIVLVLLSFLLARKRELI